MSSGNFTCGDTPMDFDANLHSMERYGRIARICAMACLAIACILLLVSLATPSGSNFSQVSAASFTLRLT
jgi:hypothetical protein